MASNANSIITKENWVSNFTLIGKPKITDYTFRLNQKSEKSDWIYSDMNIGIDCGEKHGVVYAKMMGGYSAERENVIYAHGKKEDGADDFSAQTTVAWEDRFNESILADIGDLSFINIGLERTSNGKPFYKKFLSAYDAIDYIQQNLREDMVVVVRGNLRYSTYQGETSVQKNITSIALSSAEKEEDYVARFTQSVLIDKYSFDAKEVDKERGIAYINGRVLDYVKDFNGQEVKGQFPFNIQYEFPMNFSNETLCKNIIKLLFSVKKDVDQVTFEGQFVNGNAVSSMTLADIGDDIKNLIALGFYTEEQAVAYAASTKRGNEKMMLLRPLIRRASENEPAIPAIYRARYTENDLILPCMVQHESSSSSVTGDETENGEDMDWLNDL